MNDTNKDDASRSTTTNPQRSGSDTASAANISAGTSVGNAGQPATPYGEQGGAGSSQQGSSSASSSGSQGSSTGTSGQGSGSSSSYGQQGSPGSSGQSSGSSLPGQQGSLGSSGQGAGSPSSYGQGTLGSSSQGSGSTSYGQQGSSGSGGQGSDWARSAASNATRHGGGEQSGSSEWTREQYRQGARQLYQARNNSLQQFRSARGGVERFVAENPLMVGVMGLAAGLVIGALLPRTRQEDRAFGRWADEVRQQGMRYARDATQRGREYVEEALGGAESEEEDWHPEEDNRGSIRSAPRYQNH